MAKNKNKKNTELPPHIIRKAKIFKYIYIYKIMGFPSGSAVKNPPTIQET